MERSRDHLIAVIGAQIQTARDLLDAGHVEAAQSTLDDTAGLVMDLEHGMYIDA